MARENGERPQPLTRRIEHYRAGEGLTVYYGTGGVIVAMPPSRLGRWYQRVSDWAEMLIDVVEKLDNLIYGHTHRQPSALRPRHDGLVVPTWFGQIRYLGMRTGHALLLLGYVIWWLLRAGAYLSYKRINSRSGSTSRRASAPPATWNGPPLGQEHTPGRRFAAAAGTHLRLDPLLPPADTASDEEATEERHQHSNTPPEYRSAFSTLATRGSVRRCGRAH